MFGVAAAHLAPDVTVAARPEAREVGGDRERPARGRHQRDEERPPGNKRVLGYAQHLLQP